MARVLIIVICNFDDCSVVVRASFITLLFITVILIARGGRVG